MPKWCKPQTNAKWAHLRELGAQRRAEFEEQMREREKNLERDWRERMDRDGRDR